MQKQALLKQKPGAIAQHPARQRPKSRRAATKKSISAILKKSEYWPLTLLGHCVQFFGVSAVAGALIGAAAVYGYAFFRPLPFISVAGQSSTIKLHGTVRGSDTKPMQDEFYVGVLASQLGPVQSSDGSFVLEVPKSNAYDVALWNGGTVRSFMVSRPIRTAADTDFSKLCLFFRRRFRVSRLKIQDRQQTLATCEPATHEVLQEFLNSGCLEHLGKNQGDDSDLRMEE